MVPSKGLPPPSSSTSPSTSMRLPALGLTTPWATRSATVVPVSTVRVMPFTVMLNVVGFKYRYTPTPMAPRMTTAATMPAIPAFLRPFFLYRELS